VPVVALSCPTVVHAAQRLDLYLEVTLNGRPVAQLWPFVEEQGHLYASAATLRAIGLIVPDQRTGAEQRVDLDDLPGLTYLFHPETQSLEISSNGVAQGSTAIDWQTNAADLPLERGSPGLLVNYDVQSITSYGTTADLQTRLFSPYGLISSESILSTYGPTAHDVRLNSDYSYADPDHVRRYIVGDTISSGLSYSNPIRLGGVQVTTDFTLRPDLVTFPVPSIAGSAAVPSTVDILVNGIKQISDNVQSGPFSVSQIPLVTGAGEVSLVVKDALGRESVQTVPFYASQTLLKEGLSAYSLEAGFVRRSFGLVSNDYGPSVYSGTWRYGITDRVTVESHAEGSQGLLAAGGGAAVEVGTFGVASADVAASNRDARTGMLLAISFEHDTQALSFGAAVAHSSEQYLDIAAINGNGRVADTSRLSIGYNLSSGDTVGAAYTRVIKPGLENVALLTATYSHRFFGNVYSYLTGFKDFHTARSYGMAIGITVPLGDRQSLSAMLNSQPGARSATLEAMQSALVQGDLGWRVDASSGRAARRSAEGDYITPYGELTAEVSNVPGGTFARVEARGSFLLMDDQLRLSNYVDDSFALVHVDGQPDVTVRYENRPVGKTDANGDLLIPFLRSYDSNVIEIDPQDLPIDSTVESTKIALKPADHIGVIVPFHVKTGASAVVRFVDANGQVIPAGAMAKSASDGAKHTVGYDGEVFFDALVPENHVQIEHDGVTCHASFAFSASAGNLKRIGPISCQ
jgi:outer membrane usher protein